MQLLFRVTFNVCVYLTLSLCIWCYAITSEYVFYQIQLKRKQMQMFSVNIWLAL